MVVSGCSSEATATGIPAGTIRGTLVNSSDSKVPGQSLVLLRITSRSGNSLTLVTAGNAHTDSDGDFVFSNVDAGSYMIDDLDSGLGFGTLSAICGSDGNALTFDMPASTGLDLGKVHTPNPNAEPSARASSLPSPSQLLGPFTETGSQTAIHYNPAAILLPDWRVLVAGNNAVAGGTVSADIYDPSKGTFARTGLNLGFSMETATLLADGRVLFIGGKVAALYEPTTDTSSPTGSLSADFAGHTATLLADGRVLIAGGSVTKNNISGPAEVTSAEVYDPKKGTFTPTGSLIEVRQNAIATLLVDGRVLVAGFRTNG